MTKRDNLWILLTLFLLLSSCDNKTKHDLPLSDVEERWGIRYQKELEDSLAKEKAPKDEPVIETFTKPARVSRRYSSSEVISSSDNMRGFDPASEDDMDVKIEATTYNK